jgi:hypothetical protein
MMAARSCTPGGRLHTVRIAGSKLRVCDSQTHDATTKTTAMASRLSWVKTRRRRGVRSGDAWSHWLHLSPTASITAASHEESDGARRLGGCVEHDDGTGGPGAGSDLALRSLDCLSSEVPRDVPTCTPRTWSRLAIEQHPRATSATSATTPPTAPAAAMAIISASAMIRSISLFHMTLAVVLLRSPQIIANQSMVLLLGQSMQLVSNPLPARRPLRAAS